MKIILVNDNTERIEAMAETVREVLPDAAVSIIPGGIGPFSEASSYVLIESGMDMKTMLTHIRSNRILPYDEACKSRIRIETFGIFEVFVDDIPLNFYYSKSKELFAFLVDRRGKFCSAEEIAQNLWQEDEKTKTHMSYVSRLKKDMLMRLSEKGCEDVILKKGRMIALDTKKVECDFYGWISGKLEPEETLLRKYMQQYSWAEVTAAWISADIKKQAGTED